MIFSAEQEATMYFYWQKTLMGVWTPVKSHEAPQKSATGGYSPKVRDVIKLDDVEVAFDLDSLAQFYPIKGVCA